MCLNTDRAYFERGGRAAAALADLTDERYRDLLVVENPATSTPGLAFLLATVAEFGDRWPDFWRDLRENGVLVVDGWEEAYTQRFSGAAGGEGGRPIVVSYASSPAAEVVFAGTALERAPTAVVAASCFRQVELAGVLRGRAERGRRAGADRLHALAGLPGATCRSRCSSSPSARASRSRPSSRSTRSRSTSRSSCLRRRSAPTATAGSASGPDIVLR